MYNYIAIKSWSYPDIPMEIWEEIDAAIKAKVAEDAIMSDAAQDMMVEMVHEAIEHHA